VQKKKLAIISTYNELCGIAAYTKYIKQKLDDQYDVTVFDLDQYLLRNTNRRVKPLADQHIAEICAALPQFDYVNLQLEHGTLGFYAKDIVGRMRQIIEAAPNLSVTFHTMLSGEAPDYGAIGADLLRFKFGKLFSALRTMRRDRLLTKSPMKYLRNAQKTKRVSAIVHTRKDMRFLKYVQGIENVFDHPLAFLDAETAQDIRATSQRQDFPLLADLDDKAVLIGVFGFIGRYKGFDVVINALRRLPENYHLAIFGGVHPNEIKKNQAISQQLESLLQASRADATTLETTLSRLSESGAKPNISMSVDVGKDLISKDDGDLSDRIHFMGAPNDDNFLKGLAVSDIVVMPYLEVGQSSSGPMSMALEMQCDVIASRTRTFMELSRYQPDTFEFFEVGNFVELAHRIESREGSPRVQAPLQRTTETNVKVYMQAFGDYE